MSKIKNKMPLIIVGTFVIIVLFLALSISFRHFLFFLFFPVLLIIILCVGAYVFGAFGYYKTNLIRWFQGKTPKLTNVSKDCLKWTRKEAIEKTKQAIDEMESLTKEISNERTKTWHKLAKDLLAAVEDEAASTEHLYNLCERIRKQKIKGFIIFSQIHDWLLERADEMKNT
jgi:hypothetical protein